MLRSLMICSLAFGMFAGCGSEDDPAVIPGVAAPTQTIPEVAQAAGTFNTLLSAVTTAGLAETLSGPGPFTVFAPTDAAFTAFEQANPGVIASLSPAELGDILRYHVVSGRVVSSGLANGEVATLLPGKSITVDLTGGVTVNGANVTMPDVNASNGVIHIIDAVLLPPADQAMQPPAMQPPAVQPPAMQPPTMEPALADIVDTAVGAGFSALADAVTTAGLVDTLKGAGPFTVFAPTDDAFAAFEAANPGVLGSLTVEELTAILTYHVVSGRVMSGDLVEGLAAETVNGAPILLTVDSGAMVNDATISTPDVEASNGVIHVIDSIILPPSMNLVETAIDAGTFTTLASALTDADLVGTLQDGGPFTVFAPTDAAFTAFEQANPGVLGSLSKEDLTQILLYHVVDGYIGSGQLENGMTMPTLTAAGDTLDVVIDSGVKIDMSTVTTANIVTSNGIIHVIDAVLLP